jgi:hypothetical protein
MSTMPDPSTTSLAPVRPLNASWPYRLAMVLAVAVAALIVGFFVIGVVDGSVSSFNLALWLGILTGVAGILALAHLLKSQGHPNAGAALLSLLALPGLVYALLVILFVASGVRWN